MPKQVLEIKNFSEGVVSHPDPEDLNFNAATFSKNVNSHSKPGILSPRKMPKFISSWGPVATTIGTFVTSDLREIVIGYIPATTTHDGISIPARIEFGYGTTVLESNL